MTDVTETLGNTVKTGAKAAKGVPPYVWLIAVGGGVLVAFYFNKSKNTAPDGTNTQAPSALVYTGTGQTADNSSDQQTTTSGFQTNEAWAQAAKNWLIAQGTDAKEASDAVDLYINAQMLNTKQNAMISNVIRGIGSPPQSLPPTTGSSNPTQSSDPYADYAAKHVGYATNVQGGPSLLGTIYTVREGDTIDSIARKAYAIAPGDNSNLLFAMNNILNDNWQKIPDAKNITPGTTLYIPVLSSQEFPNYGEKIPMLGFLGIGKGAQEWEFGSGIIPSDMQRAR